MIIAITGHRPQHLPPGAEPNVKALVAWALREMKATMLISGMALGVDQWAAEVALDLGVPLLAAIPCSDQDRFWTPQTRAKYHSLLARAQHSDIVQAPYHSGCMQERNIWMVDRAAMVLAVFNGTSGGTAHCVKYAIETRARRPLPILKYDPNTLKSEWL